MSRIDSAALPRSPSQGTIPIPIACIRNGEGPTALLVAGNHSDEYEGQVARKVEPGDMRGRIYHPARPHLPGRRGGAALAARREQSQSAVSRKPDGSPTEMIAHYVRSVLLPLADVVIDLHSGGRSLSYVMR